MAIPVKFSVVKRIFFLLKLKVFDMTKAVSNREICFTKSSVIMVHFSLNFALHGLSCPPPPHQLWLNSLLLFIAYL